MKESVKFLQFKNQLAQTSPFPLLIEVESAKGSYIYGKDGKEYLDMIAGVAVMNFGHGHPTITEAIKNQIDKYMHVMVYGEMIQDSELEFAGRLLALMPSQLNMVYPVNSGTEANEAAIKLARKTTKRKEIISCLGGYHGNSNGSLSLSSNTLKTKPFEPLLPNVDFIRFNSIEDVKKITTKTAGVFVETIQGDAGVRMATKEFLTALRKRCDETGAMLIFDEIQCGMGRSGKINAFEHTGIIPDALTLGKALGGGLPIGALVSNKERLLQFSHDPILGHITTFGGHPVICASSAAALKVLVSLDFSEIEKIGAFIEKELLKHTLVKEIRRHGLMFAVDMASAEIVNEMVQKCIQNGLLAYWFLSHPDSFRLSPPLTLIMEEAQKAVTIMTKVMDEIKSL